MQNARRPINRNVQKALSNLIQRQSINKDNDTEATDIRLSHNPVTHETRIWCEGEPLRIDNPLLPWIKGNVPIYKWVDKLFDGLFFASNDNPLNVRFYGIESDFKHIQRAQEKHGGDITLKKYTIKITIIRNPYEGTTVAKFGSAFSAERFPAQPNLPNKNWSTLLVNLIWRHCNVYAGMDIVFKDYELISRDFLLFEKKVKQRSKITNVSVTLQRSSLPYINLLYELKKTLPSLSVIFETVLIDIIKEANEINITGEEIAEVNRAISLPPTVFVISDNDVVSKQIIDEMLNLESVFPSCDEQNPKNRLCPDFRFVERNKNAVSSSGIYSPFIDAIIFIICVQTDSKKLTEDKDFFDLIDEIKKRGQINENHIYDETTWTVDGKPLNPEAICKGAYKWTPIIESINSKIIESFTKIKYMHYKRACKTMLNFLEHYDISIGTDIDVISDLKKRINILINYSQEVNNE